MDPINRKKFNNGQLISWCFFIVSLGKIGFVKTAPGTLSGIVYLPITIIITYFCSFSVALLALLSFIIIALIAMYYLKHKGFYEQDANYIVIDELIGQLITFLVIPITFADHPMNKFLLIVYLVGFLAFRILDIKKISLIKYVDRKINNPVGVLLDDMLAGLLAAAFLNVFANYIFYLF